MKQYKRAKAPESYWRNSPHPDFQSFKIVSEVDANYMIVII